MKIEEIIVGQEVYYKNEPYFIVLIDASFGIDFCAVHIKRSFLDKGATVVHLSDIRRSKTTRKEFKTFYFKTVFLGDEHVRKSTALFDNLETLERAQSMIFGGDQDGNDIQTHEIEIETPVYDD